MKTELGYKYNLGIKVVTPVSIGCNSILSPLSDYWVDGKNAYKVNHQKLEQALEAKPDILAAYITAINDASNANKNRFLYDFIKNKLKEDPKDFISETISILGRGNVVELRTGMRDRGQFLIPGSTIKGAVKSAMLYNWMMREEHEDKMIDLLNDLEFLYDDSEKKLSEEEKIMRTTIDDFLSLFLEKMDKTKRLNFSLLKVEDAYFENIYPVWIHASRYPLKFKKDATGRRMKAQEKEKIPVFLEAIHTGETSAFSVIFEDTVKIKNSNPRLAKYFNENGMNELLKDINRYSIANLEYEKACVLRKIEMASYLKKLELLEDQISQAGNGTAFIPLGFGKTNFYQSIGLAIYNWINILKKDEDIDVLNFAFESYLRLFGIGKKGQKELPTTRTLIKDIQQPLGWIKLTLK
jgi:CRISPR-associated protein Csm5